MRLAVLLLVVLVLVFYVALLSFQQGRYGEIDSSLQLETELESVQKQVAVLEARLRMVTKEKEELQAKLLSIDNVTNQHLRQRVRDLERQLLALKEYNVLLGGYPKAAEVTITDFQFTAKKKKYAYLVDIENKGQAEFKGELQFVVSFRSNIKEDGVMTIPHPNSPPAAKLGVRIQAGGKNLVQGDVIIPVEIKVTTVEAHLVQAGIVKAISKLRL